MITIENFSNVCFYLGVISLIILLLKTFIPFESGSEVTADFNSITDADTSFNLLSLDSVLSFFMCFGWMGWWAQHYQSLPLKICLLISVLSGLFGMFVFAFLFAQIRKLEFVPKNDLNELANKTGKAYTRFNPKGNGQIQIEFNSKLATLDAINNSEAEINSFEQIKVVKVENSIIYIEKIQ